MIHIPPSVDSKKSKNPKHDFNHNLGVPKHRYMWAYGISKNYLYLIMLIYRSFLPVYILQEAIYDDLSIRSNTPSSSPNMVGPELLYMSLAMWLPITRNAGPCKNLGFPTKLIHSYAGRIEQAMQFGQLPPHHSTALPWDKGPWTSNKCAAWANLITAGTH